MNDLTSMLDAGCTIIIKLAVACVLLALARLILAWAKPKPETLVWANTNGVTTGSSGESYKIEFQPSPAPAPEPVSVPSVVPAKPSAPEPEPAPETSKQSIVCGNCNHEIKSAPVGDGNDATIYQCETCGMRVKVPLSA